jgi:hypothetical protein
MSFGLRTLKKENTETVERHFKRHLVVGNDLFALSLYRDLKAKFGASEVGLIGEVNKHPWGQRPFGPSRVRGTEALALAEASFTEHSFSLESAPAKFLKEGSFREFGSRSKPEELLIGEEFFIEPQLQGLEQVLPSLSQGELDSLQEDIINIGLKDIQKRTPNDLVENANWAFIGLNGMSFECEHAYFSDGPAVFLELYQAKNQLNDKVIEFCEAHQMKAELGLRFVVEAKIIKEEGTFFIPLSYTHPWGHFIGEEVELKDGLVHLDFIHFLDKLETTEEEIGKKIRLLKRQIEKINPDFEKKCREEFIFMRERSPCLKFDNEKWESCGDFFEKMNFVSCEAPLDQRSLLSASFEDSLESVAGELRGVLNQLCLKKSLSFF